MYIKLRFPSFLYWKVAKIQLTEKIEFSKKNQNHQKQKQHR